MRTRPQPEATDRVLEWDDPTLDDMPEQEGCPFCSVPISPHLSAYGGPCPSCCGSIPGQQTATDLGAMVRTKRATNGARRRRRRMVIPGLLAGIVATGVFATALALALWPEPQLAELDLDDDVYAGLAFDFVASSEPEPPSADPTPQVDRTATRQNKERHSLDALRGLKIATVATGPTPEVAAASGPVVGASRGSRSSRAAAIEDVLMPANLGTGGTTGDIFAGRSFGVVTGGVERNATQGVTLTDQDAIVAMVQRVMGVELRQLSSCYAQALKQNDSLQGQWVLMFTVAASGATTGVEVEARQQTNAAMESCIVTKMKKWRFQPIKSDLPVKKTVRYRPTF